MRPLKRNENEVSYGSSLTLPSCLRWIIYIGLECSESDMAPHSSNDQPSALSISCFCSASGCSPAGSNLSILSSYEVITDRLCFASLSDPSASGQDRSLLVRRPRCFRLMGSFYDDLALRPCQVQLEMSPRPTSCSLFAVFVEFSWYVRSILHVVGSTLLELYDIFAFGDQIEEGILVLGRRTDCETEIIKLLFFRFDGGEFGHQFCLFEQNLSVHFLLWNSFVH